MAERKRIRERKNMRESASGCEILNLNALKQSFGSEYQELITAG